MNSRFRRSCRGTCRASRSRPASRPQRIVLVTSAGSITRTAPSRSMAQLEFRSGGGRRGKSSRPAGRAPVSPACCNGKGSAGSPDGFAASGDPLPRRRTGRIPARPLWRGWPPVSVPASIIEFCAGQGIATCEVDSLTSQPALAAIEAIQPDLLVHAGAGIIRRPLLAVSRLGMINAHMGILPFYRGVNVAEWAAFNGDPIGCSVHLIDDGIDTGDILAIRQVDAARADSIASLRALVNAAQIELLGEIVRYVAATGELPPRHPQESGAVVSVLHDTPRDPARSRNRTVRSPARHYAIRRLSTPPEAGPRRGRAPRAGARASTARRNRRSARGTGGAS